MIDYEKENHNLNYWNELVGIHFKGSKYGVDRFLAGHTTLNNFEKDRLNLLQGSNLLHLQCQFGLDTLSIARDYQVYVTGLDFSPVAIARAEQLANESKINGEFICSDVYSFNRDAKRKFDFIYTSYGVLTWISDLNEWALTISRSLSKGGVFMLIDEHPFGAIFSGDKSKPLQVCYPYSSDFGAYITNNATSYSGDKTLLTPQNQIQYKWGHSLSEILLCLKNAGLSLIEFEELNKSFYNAVPNMSQRSDGYWYLDEAIQASIPFMMYIKCIKT